jgi:AcrR family transcriptional regulator
MEIFWSKGYDGASISDLTSAMGIASPSLYAAFGSKERLFREALDVYEAIESPEIWDPVVDAPTAYESVEGFLLKTARVFTRPGKPPGCLVVLSALHATETCAQVRDELVQRRAGAVKGLAERFLRAVQEGEIDAGVDLTALATYFVTVQQGMSIQARDGATEDQLRSIAKAALAAWGPLTRQG